MSVQSRVKAFESLGNGPSTSASVDLKDWNVLDDPPLINFHSDSPPMPPKITPLIPPKPGSLTVQQHTYPPGRRGHAPSSSISSFHSVSLSDDDRSTAETADTHFTGFSENASQTSLDDSSFENVSTTESIANPISAKQLAVDWEKHIATNTSYNFKPRPPKLPQRPGVKSPPPVITSGIHPQRSASTSSSSSGSSRTKPAPSLTSSTSTVILSPSSPANPSPTPIHSSVSESWTLTSPNPTSAPSSPPPSQNPPYSPYLRRTTSNSSFNSINKQKPPPPPIPKSKPDISGGITNLKRRLSQASTASTSRPTPAPATARRRYEAVFDENVRQSRRAKRERMKTRALERERENLLSLGNGEKPARLSPEQARKTRNSSAGWRGLSIDLVTGEKGGESKDKGMFNGSDEDDERPVGANERLEAGLVKIIWSRSRLPKERLKEIWTECDSTHVGSLDKASFITGMWRIDEELRKAQRDPTKYMDMKLPPVSTPSRPPSLKPKPKTKSLPPNPNYPPSLPIRPPSRPISPKSHSPTSSTSSFTSLGGSSLSSGPHSLSVSPSPPSTFGSYVAVGRVNANGGVGSVGGTINAAARRKPPPPPMPLPLPSPT
ncbi:hypothetical protein V5O48_000896 [Marasmius crinis-equi]|uniref:EH domain-containing protein n=1 Tax=Marasmius crinis-equi TaxID=585013 RepID=A0ABR3G0F9_9AGAR